LKFQEMHWLLLVEASLALQLVRLLVAESLA
jgi:hypothetical protein